MTSYHGIDRDGCINPNPRNQNSSWDIQEIFRPTRENKALNRRDLPKKTSSFKILGMN
jgi:hypothetical protein